MPAWPRPLHPLVPSALLALAALTSSGCRHELTQAPPPSTAAATAPALSVHQRFERLVDDVFEAKMRFSPSTATAWGFHTHDAELEDYSRSRLDARMAELRELATRISAFDTAGPSEEQRSTDDAIDRRALLLATRSELYELETIRAWENDPLGYVGAAGDGVFVIMKRKFAPAAERGRALLSRLERVPGLYAAARENLKNPPAIFVDAALRNIDGSVDFFGTAVPQWARAELGDAPELQAKVTVAAQKASIATREFEKWLQKDLKPRAHGEFALGTEKFMRKLELGEMITLSRDALKARGEAQLEKDRAAFIDTAKRIDPERPPNQVFASLSADHPSPENLIPSVARSVEKARAFVVSQNIATIPSEVRPVVTETPPFARAGVYASMDAAGPYEQHATESFYYVTPVEPGWTERHKQEHLGVFNRAVTDVVDVHEVWPGHYLQGLYSRLPQTKVRRLIGVNSNVEGWAHYAEQMMVDQGFNNHDPKTRLGQLSEALLRDCRYLVAIGLHTEGMTVAEGEKTFVNRCFTLPNTAREETLRGTFDPTYLYYTYGKLELQALAKEYLEKKHGTLQQFHDAFLRAGTLGLPLTREIVLR